MADVAEEIMQFVKLKDRPSALELRLIDDNRRTILTITAPVESGEFVWKVAQGNGPPSVSYSIGSEDAVAMLILGVRNRLFLPSSSYLEVHLHASCLGKWPLSSPDDETNRITIRNAILVLKTK